MSEITAYHRLPAWPSAVDHAAEAVRGNNFCICAVAVAGGEFVETKLDNHGNHTKQHAATQSKILITDGIDAGPPHGRLLLLFTVRAVYHCERASSISLMVAEGRSFAGKCLDHSLRRLPPRRRASVHGLSRQDRESQR